MRVYYEDTDAGGVVYHASYLRFCERARTDMLALVGIDLADAARDGQGQFVVADAHLRFLHPARLGDALLIESRIVRMRAAACVVQQNVMRDRAVLVEARLTIALVGGTGVATRPRRLPRSWHEALAAVSGDASDG